MVPYNACSRVRCTTWQRTTRAQRQASTLSRSLSTFLPGPPRRRKPRTLQPPEQGGIPIGWQRDRGWVAEALTRSPCDGPAGRHDSPRRGTINGRSTPVGCEHPNPPPYSSPAARPAGQPHACNVRPYRTSGGHASGQRDTDVQTRSVLNQDPDPYPRSRCPCQVPKHPREHAGWA